MTSRAIAGAGELGQETKMANSPFEARRSWGATWDTWRRRVACDDAPGSLDALPDLREQSLLLVDAQRELRQ